MIKYLPDIIKNIFKVVICMLAVFVFSVWWVITFDTKDWAAFLNFMWNNHD